jgi:hypothetical protein
LIYAFDAYCRSCYAFGPGVRELADANSEVSSTTAGFIPPRSRITGVRYSAARAITLPVRVLPVKKMKARVQLTVCNRTDTPF